MKTYLYIFIFALLSATLAGCSDNDEQLKQWVKEEMASGTYPIEGEGYSLDSLSATPGLNLYVHFTFPGASRENFTEEEMAAMMFEFKYNRMKSVISDSGDMKRFRNAGVTFHFEYRNEYGEEFINITITPEEYKKAMKSR